MKPLTDRFDFGDVIDVITFAKINGYLAVRRGFLKNFQSVHHFCFSLRISQRRMIKKILGSEYLYQLVSYVEQIGSCSVRSVLMGLF